MIFRQDFHALIALTLAGCVVVTPARALVSLNEGRDRIYVSGSFGVTHDSNVFAASSGAGDFIYSSGVSAEYSRRAGWIGLNANVAISAGHFGVLRGQDFNDPSIGVELTKQTGRTTGSLTLHAARESRADAAVNTRVSSWNYSAGLNTKYHIAGNYDLAGQFGFSLHKYAEETIFSNLASYSASLDLFHVLSTERDVILGYRYRLSETSRNTNSADHAFTGGVHGKVLRGISGTLRAGYQLRVPSGGGTVARKTYQSWTGSAAVSYAITKTISISGQLSKDFSTTASDASVDTLMASLDGQYAYSSHWSFSSSLGWGDSQFLGQSGRVILDVGPPPLLGPSRHDNYLTWNLSGGYTFNEHLKLGLSHVQFKNWSTSSFADFVRSSWSFSLSSRW